MILGAIVSEINQLDLSLLQGYLDNLGNNVVQQMLDLYIQQSKIYLIDIENNVSAEKQVAWQDSCHKMKGAAGSVGLLIVYNTLVEIEKSTILADEKMVYVKELVALNNNAISAFREWL
jgi:HPt (histidine-containing phosphotransfer) domain-containing protein